MTNWHSNGKRHKRKNLAAALDLTEAYRSVFLRNPSQQQQQEVLADLAARCGWNQITLPRDASDRELWFAEGKRAAFAEIFAHLSLAPDDVDALANAVRTEVALSNQ